LVADAYPKFRCSRGVAEALSVRAAEAGLSVSEFLRGLVERFLAGELVEPSSAVSAGQADITLEEIRQLGVESLRAYRERLRSGKPMGDTALSKNIERLAQILEEERRREEERNPDLQARAELERAEASGYVDWLLVCVKQGRITRSRGVEALRDDYIPRLRRHMEETEQKLGALNGAAHAS
jgi:hypothetical protein